MTAAEPWVTLQDVCEHLKISEDTIYRWMDKRGLPAHRIGRVWRFKLSEVDDWVLTGAGDDGDESPASEQP